MKKSNFCAKSVSLMSLPSVYVAVFAMLFTFASCSDDDDDVDDSVSISDDDDVDDSASISDDDDDDVDDSASISDDDDADDSASVDDGYEASGTINGHEYVNLGLSVLWATCNIGADSPEDYGDYFAWGETETKDLFTSGSSFLISNISGDATYDAATANWGDSWRMPTYDEMKELVANCTWIWMTQNDVNGYLVTGSTGNSIFLPAAGYYDDSSLYYAGEAGDYWSSIMYNTLFAYTLVIHNGFHDISWGRSRLSGQSVRPVSDY